MSKEELVRVIYNSVNRNMPHSGFTLKNSNEVFDDLLTAVKQSLFNDEEVRIPTFGRLYVNHTGERTIPHPKMPGQLLNIGPRKQLKFKAFPKTKNELNGKD